MAYQRSRQPANRSPKTSWEPVADWYGKHLAQRGTFHETIIFPKTLTLLDPQPEGSYVDLACGEGSFSRFLTKQIRATTLGIDASAHLIKQAQKQASRGSRFIVGDATHFASQLPKESADGMTCILALQNIEPLAPVFRDAAQILKTEAPFVIVLNHPCFRQPRQSGWGWDEQRKLQYRRLDAYMSPYEMPIIAHPGSDPRVKTYSYHRPLSEYIHELCQHGFAIDALEEWVSEKASDSGPRAKAENIARAEFPLFMAIRARKQSA